jgi:hypothetical protein
MLKGQIVEIKPAVYGQKYGVVRSTRGEMLTVVIPFQNGMKMEKDFLPENLTPIANLEGVKL